MTSNYYFSLLIWWFGNGLLIHIKAAFQSSLLNCKKLRFYWNIFRSGEALSNKCIERMWHLRVRLPDSLNIAVSSVRNLFYKKWSISRQNQNQVCEKCRNFYLNTIWGQKAQWNSVSWAVFWVITSFTISFFLCPHVQAKISCNHTHSTHIQICRAQS